jgi:hypothetical protein
MSYFDRLVTEATLQEADEYGSISEALRHSGHETLATIARKPQVIAAINRAREVASKERWAELCRRWDPTEAERKAASQVLDMMPGYCCLNDAANITARL